MSNGDSAWLKVSLPADLPRAPLLRTARRYAERLEAREHHVAQSGPDDLARRRLRRDAVRRHPFGDLVGRASQPRLRRVLEELWQPRAERLPRVLRDERRPEVTPPEPCVVDVVRDELANHGARGGRGRALQGLLEPGAGQRLV